MEMSRWGESNERHNHCLFGVDNINLKHQLFSIAPVLVAAGLSMHAKLVAPSEVHYFHVFQTFFMTSEEPVCCISSAILILTKIDKNKK